MQEPLSNKIEILDCTIRDGGYVNNWNFDKKLVRETYRSLSKAGIDYIELGYHGTNKYFDLNKYGAFRFCDISDINYVTNNILGAKIALMVDFGKYDLEELKQYIGSSVKLIRIAFHKDKTEQALNQAIAIKELGFNVSANLMGFSTYKSDEMDKLCSLLNQLSLDYVYVADTYGSMFPNQVNEYFSFLSSIKHIKWGFHPHNNLQMSFANSLAAITAGAQIIDGSIYGMGRGAGNLPTEIMLSYLQLVRPERYNVIPVLNLIDQYYRKLRQDYGWGYELPYMISGIHGCHPDYPKNLIDRKEHNMEDIWNILEIIKAEKPIGYKKETLEKIIQSGMFGQKNIHMVGREYKRTDQSKTVKYANRHLDKDFLVLANGQCLKEKSEQVKIFIKKYKPVVLGANYLKGLFVPDYHAFSNKRRFMNYIEMVDRNSKLLIGEHIPLSMIRDYISRDYEIIYYEDTSDTQFEIKNNIISSNCRTVSLLLTAVAIIMGAKRIFIAGMDGYAGKGVNGNFHFYSEEEALDNEVIREKHECNLRYLNQINAYLISKGKEGLHIITPTSYKTYYKGIENYLEAVS